MNNRDMETKRLIVPFDVKIPGGDSPLGVFSGYGSTFGNIDLGGDIVERGAFRASLDDWKSKNMLPQLLWYHDSEKIIGDWISMEEDELGLKVQGKLWIHGDLSVPEAVTAYNVLMGTSVKGLSIGYRVRDFDVQEQADGSQVRILKEIDLMEVSIAPWAMNPQASVTGVKDEQGKIKTKRDIEKILRDAGFSRRESKAVLAGGYNALCRDGRGVVDADQCDADLDDGDVLASLKTLSTTILGK